MRVAVLVAVPVGVRVDDGVGLDVAVRVGVAVPIAVTYWDATQPLPIEVLTGMKVNPSATTAYPVTNTCALTGRVPMMLALVEGAERKFRVWVT